MTKWEYITTFIGGNPEGVKGQCPVNNRLDEFGDDCWELVAIVDCWGYFKRPTSETCVCCFPIPKKQEGGCGCILAKADAEEAVR